MEAEDFFFLECFEELGTCRSIGMGIGPIPWTAAKEYAKEIEYPFVQDFCAIIRVMDTAFLKANAEKNEKK